MRKVQEKSNSVQLQKGGLVIVYMLYKLYNLYRFTHNVSPWVMALASPYRAESKPILVAECACYSQRRSTT
jgi:hypothetical protein